MTRRLFARIQNPFGWECHCLSDCFCRRTRLGSTEQTLYDRA
jgi:hypothetical protein